jgi:hypothetical protein
MKKQLLSRKRLLPLFCSLCVMLCVNLGWGQTTVFYETFGTTASSTFTGGTSTTPLSITYTPVLSQGTITTVVNSTANSCLSFVGGGVIGSGTNRPNLSFPFSGLSLGTFSTTLANNTLPVEWTVNMRMNRLASSNSQTYVDQSYYLAVVLCATNATLAGGTGSNTDGYALIMQRVTGGTTNALRLVNFHNGIGSSALGSAVSAKLIETPVFTNIAPSISAPNNIAVKVVYTPTGGGTGTWEMFYKEDSTTPFVDPTTLTLVSAGTSADATYTGSLMTHFGLLASLTNSTSVSHQIDNFKIKGGAGTTPTITSSVSSLSGFAYNQGSGPSTGQSFNVVGTNLSNNLVVTPSTNYEI